MTEEQAPTEPSLPTASVSAESAPAKAAKKAAKKTAKKAAKKVAKKTTGKAAKKAATTKKIAKKATKKKDDGTGELNLGLEEDRSPGGNEAMDEAAAAEREAAQAAEAAIEAAAKAEEAAHAAKEAALKLATAKKAAKKRAIVPRDSGTRPDSSKEEPADHEEPKEPKPKRDLPPPPPPPEVPDEIDLNDFRNEPLADLYDEAERLPVRIPNQVTCAHLAFAVLSCYLTHGTRVVGEGVLDLAGGKFGMLRDEARSFRGAPDDLYLPAELLRKYELREGQRLKVTVRAPGHRDQYLGVDEILEIDGCKASEFQPRPRFDELTSLFPEERFVLEGEDDGAGLATRVVDLVAPLGKGQRGLIVAPPRGGKTILLKQIAKSIQLNYPEVELVILLLDERPEEVTDFEEMVGRNVFASTFDEPSKRHAEVANLVLERSRRMVEEGKDVVILLDSLTRLARGYNNAVRGGPIGSGGISPRAISDTRKFFGAARNVEEGGSLTILATCLIETESRMDDVIFEELKGTGNMEVRLDRELAEQRIYPAIHIPQSGTRNDDRLYHPEELPRVQEIRRHLASLPIGEAIEKLLKNLARTKTNTELLLQGLR